MDIILYENECSSSISQQILHDNTFNVRHGVFRLLCHNSAFNNHNGNRCLNHVKSVTFDAMQVRSLHQIAKSEYASPSQELIKSIERFAPL